MKDFFMYNIFQGFYRNYISVHILYKDLLKYFSLDCLMTPPISLAQLYQLKNEVAIKCKMSFDKL